MAGINTGIGKRRAIKLVDETPLLVNGEPEPQTVTIYRGWAEVKLKDSSRVVQYNQTQIEKLFEFRFRHREEIKLNANVKIVYNGAKHTIQSIERESEKTFYWKVTTDAKTFE